MEERYIIVSEHRIDYLFTRKRVKNLNLRVQKDGSVHVSAPMRTPISRVDAFVRDNASLILRALERVKQYPSTRALDEGDAVYFLGEPYELAFVCGKTSLVFENGKAILTLPSRNRDLEKMYFSLSGEKLLPLLKERCAALEAAFPHLKGHVQEIRVRYMKSMWANCRPKEGRLTFSSTLASMPIPLIDGVIAHEYAHFFYGGHGKSFYAFLATISPDHKELSLALKRTKREQLFKKI